MKKKVAPLQKVTPFLWLDGGIEEAVKFYASVFRDTKVATKSPMSAILTIAGQRLMLFNGGPHFKLNEAFSLFVNCQTQKEVDRYWDKLSAGGEKSRCGWVKDKFGVSWQIVPTILGKLMEDKNPAKAQATVQAMLQMGKLDIAKLKEAHAKG